MAVFCFNLQETPLEGLNNIQKEIEKEIERRRRVEVDTLIQNFEAAFRALQDAHVVVRYVSAEDEFDIYIEDEDNFYYN